MMAPTIVLREGEPELVLGSAGSNRIRSAIIQTIIRAIDDGMRAGDAVHGPACTTRTASSTPSPGWTRRLEARVPLAPSGTATCSSAASRQSSAIPHGGVLGGGDPRRGGAADRRRGDD